MSKEYIASIFRVEEEAKHETSKGLTNRLKLVPFLE
jgi:hypothetical protein